jgi:hypothetical protein
VRGNAPRIEWSPVTITRSPPGCVPMERRARRRTKEKAHA